MLYVDGACWGNPGPGGWAALLLQGGERTLLVGRQHWTTNNRMELQAALEGLRALAQPSRVRLVSDSQYVVRGLKEWLAGWERKGFPIQNADLWKALAHEARRHRLKVVWVRGHSGHPENEQVDREASQQALLAKEELEAQQGRPLPLKGGEKPPTPKQLRYLKALGHQGQEPRTLAEASRLIKRLLREGRTPA